MSVIIDIFWFFSAIIDTRVWAYISPRLMIDSKIVQECFDLQKQLEKRSWSMSFLKTA